jgi:hypothetical protein
MRRRGLLMLFCLLPTGAAVAGPCAGLGHGQVLRGRFIQERRLKGFAAPLRTEGKFVLAQAEGLIWKAEKPFPVATMITKAGLVQRVRGNETLRLPSSRLPALVRLYDMLGGALAGDWSALEPAFVLARSGRDTAWQVIFTPRLASDPAMPFSAITAVGGCFVDSVVLDRADGDADTLTFLDQTLAGGPLSAGETADLATTAK